MAAIEATLCAQSCRRLASAAVVVQRNLESMPFDAEEYLDFELPAKVDPDWGH